MFFSGGSGYLLTGLDKNVPDDTTGTLEKMIVASGNVAMEINLNRLNGKSSRAKESRPTVLRFDAERGSFFSITVFNNELRGPLPGSMRLIPLDSVDLPAKLNASRDQLVVESTPWGEPFELVIRDGKTGFLFFDIEGQQFGYDAKEHLFTVQTGRLLLSREFATALGRPADAGSPVGTISVKATMRAIEVTEVVNGQIKSESLPAAKTSDAGSVPGPDVIVGDVFGLSQFGPNSGSQVGLALGTSSCNAGTIDLNWFALPNNDHPVIPQNLYRMSGGANNDERFEQIGQSNVKHAFTALTQNICGFGCNGVGGSHLGSGCSDPYSASLNSGPNLGSRAWINPFNGDYPRGDSATPPNSHSGHSHTGPSHRILTEMDDLNTSLNPGATYYAEGQYITPHEYTWCQANPGQCNMYNNVSFRRYTVSGTTSPFSFSPVGSTVRSQAAITAWSGATLVNIEPDPGNDGIGAVAYKVTNPSPGVWHYEYAVYNQNINRAIQSFSIPVGNGVVLTNVGFHAPPQQPGWSGDGTMNEAGFSSTPWPSTQAGGALTWSTETFAQNPNANAIRWGTLYNFRFDSDRPPQTTDATIGFFKTGAPITVQVQGPSAPVQAGVSVSGRIMTASGNGIRNARVKITDSGGNSRVTYTGTFGKYRFDNVASGDMYTIEVLSGRYTFASQMLQIDNDVTNVDFTAQ
ncbi:MAG: carboxypeptidase-like regulatory domain-containing protein [Pyrinomonadaceae bacterium]